MGTVESKATLVPPFERMSEWNLTRVEKLLSDYLAKDLDFGLDYHGLSLLLDGDKEWSERIIKAFGSQNGLINVLSFITGACLVVSATPEEKAALCFKAFDFSGTGSISMDETTILFLCALRGYSVMLGLGATPADDAMEACALEVFKLCEKDNYSKITKDDFLLWATKKVAVDHANGLSSDNILGAFGLGPSPATGKTVAASPRDADRTEVSTPTSTSAE
ncbi:hypothetical protein SDRG_09881 [Saprolegnia diclina VS20]|uniref:EF-hand domain-containing protein n=1 Tax=Saprolegnia diclina (strain VS20) TaxID=1156394 RepID=T0RR68_SAPDV|nr:hypothetical protein SDRG_09881 [Saprolegnia diclina VS20]EQC32562.1 hypothetical protein SDRG_09881 [Saprolegnia diclina VS20]|eukprot:XP_008614063.1 hypothetical protein SDRG_09881 [Saprolegnia diclina VS20]